MYSGGYLEGHLIVRVVLIHNAVVEEGAVVGLRTEPGIDGLPFLVGPVYRQLHLPGAGLVSQHCLAQNSRLAINPCMTPFSISRSYMFAFFHEDKRCGLPAILSGQLPAQSSSVDL